MIRLIYCDSKCEFEVYPRPVDGHCEMCILMNIDVTAIHRTGIRPTTQLMTGSKLYRQLLSLSLRAEMRAWEVN